jgi:hypothetical protein
MANSLAVDIRERVSAYLAGELTRPQLQERLIANTWDEEQLGDAQATDLTFEIKLALAWHSRGDIRRTELQDRLHDAIKTAVPLRMWTWQDSWT